MNNHLVIMAGGVGSRFWPMSTIDNPKQFVDVLGVGKSLIQLTMQRFAGICRPENVWVVTNELYVEKVKEQLPEIPSENILSEPCRRNTAPCICYVSWRIKIKDPGANIVVTPSDHIVTDTIEFQRVIKSALHFTADSDAILTLGMKPSRPETGYGYIKADFAACSMRNRNIYSVDLFKEKPSLDVAKEYIKQKDYFWNAGIFIWNVSTIINAFRLYAPTINRVFERMQDVMGSKHEQQYINENYSLCDNISIDYAIIEKAEEIYVMPSDFGWSDLGTWGSLWSLTEHDDHGNSCIGNNILTVNSSNCIVHATDEKRVVIEGLDGYIVAEKEGVLLICRMSEEQNIKTFVD